MEVSVETAGAGLLAGAPANMPRQPGPGPIARKRLWLRDLPARLALRFCNHPLVGPALARRHAQARAKHSERLPELTGLDAEIVAAVDRDGVFVTTLDALGIHSSEEVVAAGRALAERFAVEARERAAAGEAFLYVPSEWLLAHPAIFTWGLHERVLNIAEAYIGLPPAYDGACINYTVADGREISTRKWHRDWEDRRMLKVCIYLHDVGPGGGPFELVSRSDSTGHDVERFVYELADNAELERRFGGDLSPHRVSCEGPAGTVIFMDTARFFHRGKPATTSDRAAIFYSYFADRPRHPFLCQRTGMTRRHVARLAGALPERQRKAAQWYQRLPLLLRLIPPARL